MTRTPLAALFAAVVTVLFLGGCNNYIDSNVYNNESNIVLTTFDTAEYRFTGPVTPGKFQTIAMLDTVGLEVDDSLKIDSIPKAMRDSIIVNTKKELRDMGFSVDTFKVADLNDSLRDWIADNYDATVECRVAVEEYSYYTYWGGYWGGYWGWGWYYPGYVTQTSYRVADLFVTMGNLVDLPEGDGRKEIKKVWELRINDLVRKESVNVSARKVSGLIREGFGQSQYLRVN